MRPKAKQAPQLSLEMIMREARSILVNNLTFTTQLRDAKDETELRRLKDESRAAAEYWKRVRAGEIEFPIYVNAANEIVWPDGPQFGEYRALLELYNIAKTKD